MTVSVTLAVLTARRSRRGSRGCRRAWSGVSIPTFWTAILLLTVFSFQLGWFPAVGAEGLAGLVLPVIAVALPITTLLTQMMRENLELVAGASRSC